MNDYESLSTESIDKETYLTPSRGADNRRSVSSSTPGAGSPTDNVKVIARVRPFNQREFEIQDEANSKLGEWERRPLRSVINMTKSTTQFLDYHHDYNIKEEFRFDENFWSVPVEQQECNDDIEFATQELIFDKVGRVTLEHAFNGYNTCIFAYGQTGSGKTHTMMGIPSDKGLIPRFCEELFRCIHEKRDYAMENQHPDVMSVEWTVEARFLEIYNEHVKDLLWQLSDPATQGQFDKDNLKVRHNPGQGPYVVGLTAIKVESWQECDAIIVAGMSNRVVAATKMNDTSSRSHAVFRLTLRRFTTIKPQKQFERPKILERVATINLVDLAGSERLKKSGAQGQRLKEAAAINLSLTTLKNVIDALVENRPLIPYRDSQLTWLLSDSLGGNSKTFMFACLSPHFDNAEESLNTLRYALRTQGVVNHAKVNESDEAKRIAALQREVMEAQRALQDGSDGQKNALRREMDDKLQSLSELEQKRHLRHALERELMNNIEEERNRTLRAVYASAFRAKLLERLSDRLAKQKDVLSKQMVIVNTDISKAHDELAHIESEHARLITSEERVATALKRAERDHNKMQAAFNDINDTVRKLTGSLEQIEDKMRRARIRSLITGFFCGAINSVKRKKLIIDADEQARIHATEMQNEAREAQQDRTAIGVQHQRSIVRVKKEMDSIKEESATVTGQIQITNEDRKTRLRRLTEDMTFYERENRNLDDERVQSMTDLESQHSQKYQAETSRLSERSVKGRQIIEQRHAAFMHEIGRQIKMAGTEHEASLNSVAQQWGARLRKVQQESDNVLQDLAKHYTNLLKEHDSQIEDARVFQHSWEHGVRQYDPVYKELMAMMAAHKDTRDPEMKELISKLEVSAAQTSRTRALTPGGHERKSPSTRRAPASAGAPAAEKQVVPTSKGLTGSRLGSRRSNSRNNSRQWIQPFESL